MPLARTFSTGNTHSLEQALQHKRWMLFVDGENLAARARDVMDAEGFGACLKQGPYFEPGVFLWVPKVPPKVSFIDIRGAYPLTIHGHRAYYFTCAQGSDERISYIRNLARNCGFEPEVFRKPSGKHAKRVDIALTVRMLSEAHKDTYDVAVLIAGDEDYVPLVDEVKVTGKNVYLSFFDHAKGGLSNELRLASDSFFDLTSAFASAWILHDGGSKDSGDAFRLST
jgi:hypothetical protein